MHGFAPGNAKLPSSVKPTSPVIRYHPAVVQAIPAASRHKNPFVRAMGRSQQPAMPDGDYALKAIIATERVVHMFDGRLIEEVLVATGAEFPRNTALGRDQTPVLDTHMRYSVANVLGHARDFVRNESVWTGWIYTARGVAAAEDAYRLIQGQHLCDTSIGYLLQEFQIVPPGKSERIDGRLWRASNVPLRVVTKWRCIELSLVPIGADEGAKISNGQTQPRALSTSHFR